MNDLDPLLAPIDGADRCGPNLEYDPACQALERAAQHRPEQRLGAGVRPAVPADWGQVEALAAALLRRTKDWRVARLLAQAWLHRDGLVGLARGLRLLAGLAQDFGREVHPQNDDDLDEGFGRDPAWPPLLLEGDGGLLQAVRALRFGAAAGSVSAAEVEWSRVGEPGHAAARSAMQAAAAADPQLLPSLAACEAAIDAFKHAWSAWSGSPLDDLRQLVIALRRAAMATSTTVADPPAAPHQRRPAARRPVRTATPMPAPDMEAFTTPCTDGGPCGENLEYDLRTLELAQAMAGRPEQQFGSTLIEAVPPDWARACALALDLMAASRDLRPALAWTRAATRLHGLEGTSAGLRLIAQLLRCFADDLHPTPDPAEDDEPDWARRGALHALDAHDGLLGDLRAWVWGDSGAVATGAELEEHDDGGDATRQAGAVADELARAPDTPAWLQQSLDALQVLRRSMSADPGASADIGERLESHLLRLHARVLAPMQADPAPVATALPATAEPADAAAPAEDPAAFDAMRSALDALCARLGPAVDNDLCARASRLSSRRFADIERGLVVDIEPDLVGNGAGSGDAFGPGVPR